MWPKYFVNYYTVLCHLECVSGYLSSASWWQLLHAHTRKQGAEHFSAALGITGQQLLLHQHLTFFTSQVQSGQLTVSTTILWWCGPLFTLVAQSHAPSFRFTICWSSLLEIMSSAQSPNTCFNFLRLQDTCLQVILRDSEDRNPGDILII